MTEPLLEVRDVSVEYRVGAGWLPGARRVPALRQVSFDVGPGQSVGIVGESGCGKSTLARAILALTTPSAGDIRWRGWSVTTADRESMRAMRRELQVVFQDPFGSLDPRMTAGACVAEAVVALEGIGDEGALSRRVAAALVDVGLDPGLAGRYPHELSGGQCQRVAIARATVVRPRLLICDEAVSALDVSVQAQIVNLLADLCRRHQMALLFISHNLAVVRHLCEEVLVLYLGRVVERASRDELFRWPRHPYTRALLDAVPEPDPWRTPRVAPGQSDEVSVAGETVAACAFAPRCAFASGHCSAAVPALESVAGSHVVACHRWRQLPVASRATSG
jgi:oligopeptide/dipeptide ABC transporter ATP-binding protein